MTTKQLKSTPGISDIFGVSSEPQPFKPTAIFEEFNIPEDIRYTFTIKPLSEAAKTRIQSLMSSVQVQALKWVAEEGIDLSLYNKSSKAIKAMKLSTERLKAINFGYQLFHKKLKSLRPRTEEMEITRECVVNLEDYSFAKNGELVPAPYKADASGECISADLWSTIPDKVRNAVFDQVQVISNITEKEAASL